MVARGALRTEDELKHWLQERKSILSRNIDQMLVKDGSSNKEVLEIMRTMLNHVETGTEDSGYGEKVMEFFGKADTRGLL